jgi:hypothetical protein
MQLGIDWHRAQASDPAGQQGFKESCAVFHAQDDPLTLLQTQLVQHACRQGMAAFGQLPIADCFSAAAEGLQMRMAAGAVQDRLNNIHGWMPCAWMALRKRVIRSTIKDVVVIVCANP